MNKDRIEAIYKFLEENERATVEELAAKFGVSRSTIKRDIAFMEDLRMISRYYGGIAINAYQAKERSMKVKDLLNNEEKVLIAKAASLLIKDGDVVYLDGGSTTLHIVDFIGNKDVLIVTQSVDIIDKLIDKNAKCWVLSGYLKENTGMIIGTNTIKEYEDLRFSLAFIGCNSVNAMMGYSAADDLEAALKSTVIKRSDKSFALADSSKFDILTYPRFAGLKDCGIITDRLIDDFDYRAIPEVWYYDDDRRLKHMTN